MDTNEYMFSGSVYGPYTSYPVGVVPLSLEEEPAAQGYDNLTEAEKEHLILQCKDAKTADERQRIMDSVSTDIDAKGLAEEEAADNSYS